MEDKDKSQEQEQAEDEEEIVPDGFEEWYELMEEIRIGQIG